MGGLGAPELIIILLVVLLLFGSTKLPKLAKSLGEASKEFKKGIGDPDDPPPPPTAVVPPASAAPILPATEDKVTLTRAELDALLDAREAQARKADPGKDAPPAI
jgi:sec-independent protein translocase protein TatA